ncbi:Lcd1p KNAG_0F00350 [Huiozyma naganishii CBS 8797]|uniref:DNA damage checkpoint protein LCD1 n=1 Tax=Huiozyma naganishii (strain ATCC MYA-139 / BCRC 22969 / CBS 8797 / KCTC 17520 / NBRC 10181 / NCYC 3082 / Yp74L-3) TaxID=1071383 RepID=J7RZP3_HUIN7|nr:hypothetical protein KNAG_0F00350 [Kazachstania naganishii CBS 8797]CCK70707.1 hypothetical protein KNAG_0F00350 [Kazachstania naganishii CBS 8797]
MSGLSSDDEDDELILQLSALPPKTTLQDAPKKYATQVQNNTDQAVQQSKPNPTDNDRVLELEMKLTKARGETSMLRDKISLLNKEREKDKLNHADTDSQAKQEHERELKYMKQVIQNLKDEKKFLLMEMKTKKAVPTSASLQTNPQAQHQTPDTSTLTPLVKKRKLEDTPQYLKSNVVSLNSHRILPRESDLLFNSIMSFKLFGVDVTLLEILDVLTVKHIDTVEANDFILHSNESIGKQLRRFMMVAKSKLNLDKFIDTFLENLVFLITKISYNSQESKLAVPFLIALMHQIIIFRPSAVKQLCLQNLLLFVCDFILENRRVLRQPLRNVNDPELKLKILEPQVFQYEFIDKLMICYSFDLLESGLRIAQLLTNDGLWAILIDSKISNSLTAIYNLSLSVSVRPFLNAVFNIVAIFNILSNMLVTVQQDSTLIPPSKDTNGSLIVHGSWWKLPLDKLYNLLEKDVKNYYLMSHLDNMDSRSFEKNHFVDINGLIRNIGNNSLAAFVEELIHTDKLQNFPRVISKENLPIQKAHLDFEFEGWLLSLQKDILLTFNNMLLVFPEDSVIINGNMFAHLARLLAQEQQEILSTYLGQDNPNIISRVELIESTLTLIYKLWMNHHQTIGQEYIKEVENELITALRRVVASQMDEKLPRTNDDMADHRNIVDKLNELTVRDQARYYEDAFEDMPEYITKELSDHLDGRCYRIMQARYQKVYQEMAKTILESHKTGLLTVEQADALYAAMGL